MIKKFLTEAPVLLYYDVSKQVSVQCDANYSGLGTALIQHSQPVMLSVPSEPLKCVTHKLRKRC